MHILFMQLFILITSINSKMFNCNSTKTVVVFNKIK